MQNLSRNFPDGTVHDGRFYANDTGWSFEGSHIDVFAGTYDWYDIVVYQVPYNVTVEVVEY
jgi:3D (Asp-Asp-Asp) domain-containing protein